MWNSGKNYGIISLLNRNYDCLQIFSKSKYESLDKYLLLNFMPKLLFHRYYIYAGKTGFRIKSIHKS